MKPSKTPSVEELQVLSRFESLRKILLTEPYAELREKPLAYWALPSDRRLPLALLGRTLNDLLHTPFAQLAATPGIGQKKIRSFIKLLARAANTDPAELPSELALLSRNGQTAGASASATNGFDPAAVSEIVWAQWRASVVRHGLQRETLGRLAPSLRDLTRVIWRKPLGAYTGLTLAEIRALKTHGENRVRAILQVFYSVHTLVSSMGVQDHLVVCLVPRRIHEVETWVGWALQSPGVPTQEEIFRHFVQPILEQIRTDATEQIVRLAENRLGIAGPICSVRQAARMMGLTRARVYQLLNEINDILQVRWPLGRHQVYELRAKFQAEASAGHASTNLDQFHAAVELFYPGSRRGAAGPLERSPARAGQHNGEDRPEDHPGFDQDQPLPACPDDSRRIVTAF